MIPTQSEHIDQLLISLIKAKKNFPEITKDKTVKAGTKTYSYATLEGILKAITKPLLDQEIEVSFEMNQIAYENRIMDFMFIKIFHISGQWKGCIYPLYFDPSDKYEESRDGSKYKRNLEQAFGVCQSYAARYGIRNLLGLPISDETDTDGEPVSSELEQKEYKASPNKPLSDKQKNLILKHYAPYPEAFKKTLENFEVKTIDQLSSADASEIIGSFMNDK